MKKEGRGRKDKQGRGVYLYKKSGGRRQDA